MNLIEILYDRLSEHDLFQKTIALKRNAFLKLGGTTDTNLYYIQSGSLKISIMDDTDEHIIRFGYTGNFIAALDSFITDKPSNFYIQAIKKSELRMLSKETFFNFINRYPENAQLWYKIIEQVILQHMEREQDILIKSPKERYERVLERSPKLFQEVPNKYIASYLRMTPETLSRLKKS